MNIPNEQLARISDLAVENCLGAASADEIAELVELRNRFPDFDVQSVETAAAALQLAAMPRLDPLPERLRIQLATDAAEFFGPQARISAPQMRIDTTSVTVASSVSSNWTRYSGWMAAAACGVIALFLWSERPRTVRVAANSAAPVKAPAAPAIAYNEPGPSIQSNPPERLPSTVATPADEWSGAEAARERFLTVHRFVLHRSWRPGNDPAGRMVAGDVVWDSRTQQGFMRFTGLRHNNPNVEQYQLWIFDARRDERFPVDGGVFDITRADGSEVVAIKTHLKVSVPLMFAITIEPPGGVVVSDRSRIAALANSG